MGQFKLFTKRNHEKSDDIVVRSGGTGHVMIPESGKLSELRSLDPGNGAGGINEIYNFLLADYESRGYNDALINPDESYRRDNASLLQHDLLILIDKSSTYYEALLKELDFHIGSRSRAGLVDLVEELRIRRELVVDHLGKVNQIKEETASGVGAAQRITLSYQRGFMRGMYALTQTQILNKIP